jgi:hypothetical protein
MDEETRKRLAQIPNELLKLPPGVLHGFLEGLVHNSYSVHLPAHHSSRGLLGAFCARTDLLMLSGRDVTDGTGKVTIKIDDLLCGSITEDVSPAVLMMLREPDFVVTPLSATPAFATVQTASTARGGLAGIIVLDRSGNLVHRTPIQDVTVDVMTWKPDGSAAGSTNFSWICTIEAARATVIGG